MRIGIDGAPLSIPFPCGTKRYGEALIRHLADIDHENEYVVFGSPHMELPESPNVKQVSIPQWIPVLKRQLFLAHQVKKEKVDIFHYLEPYGALFLDHPRIVTTVHDINLDFTYPWRTPAFIARMYCEITRWGVLLRTKMAIAVSETIAQETRAYLYRYGGRSQVTTIYQGVDEKFRSEKTDGSAHSYILAFGDFTYRKNVGRVFEAYAMLPNQWQEKIGVKVVVSSSKFRERFEELKYSLKFDGKVQLEVGVDEQKLVDLYRNAEVLVYPSLYEGFGLPIVEAMRIGCPVITSNQGAMKEIGRGAALLVNSESVDELADAMKKVAENPDLRKRMIETGKKRARYFSWEKTALETLNVYQRIYAEG